MARPDLVPQLMEKPVRPRVMSVQHDGNNHDPAKIAIGRSHDTSFSGRPTLTMRLAWTWSVDRECRLISGLWAYATALIARRYKTREAASIYSHSDEKERQLRDLMLRTLDGDQEAYRSLLRGLIPVLIEFFSEKTDASTNDIEALVQETLTAVHLRLRTYCPDCSFQNWLYAIAAYRLPMRGERRSRQSVEAICDSAKQTIAHIIRQLSRVAGQ
jgi:hypothetical protein